VHRYDRGVERADDLGHTGISLQSGDVVDQVRSSPKRTLGHPWLARVDGKRDLNQVCQRGQNRDHAVDLLGSLNRSRARSGAFSADVEEIRAVGDHLTTQSDRLVDSSIHAIARERIRGDVDNSHYQGAVTDGEAPVATAQLTLPSAWELRYGQRLVLEQVE